MKKKIVTILLAAMMTGMLAACGTDTAGDRNSDEVIQEQDATGMVHLENAEDISAFFDEIYSGLEPDTYPNSLETAELDLSDIDMVTFNTGLSDVSQIESIMISQPMMSSIPYSMFYVRTTDEADAEAIRDEIMANVDPAKWLCVTAEKQRAVIMGNDVYFIMGYADTIDPIYEQATKIAADNGMNVTGEVEQDNPL